MRSWPAMLVLSSVTVLLCAGAKPKPGFATYTFGFSLNAMPTGEPFTLFIYKVQEDRVVEAVPISEDRFLSEAMGLQQSPANPEAADLFALYQVQGCSAVKDSLGAQWLFTCDVLFDLQKLRFNADGGLPSGWSEMPYEPSERQQLLLQNYRSPYHTHWLGPYYGEGAFRLLHDLQDPEWVENYRHGL